MIHTKHTLLTREKIRRSCLLRVMNDSWKANVRKAIIEKDAKPVKCHETGENFESISAAARWLKVAPSQVGRVCHGLRHSVHGVTFSFL